MPLYTKDGKEVLLVRPEIVDKPKPVRNLKPMYLSDYGIKKIGHTGKNSRNSSIYKVEKSQFPAYLPIFVATVFRSYATGRNQSDVATEILIHYLDDKFCGWDAQVVDRPVASSYNRECGRKISDYGIKSQRGQIKGVSRGRIKGEKIVTMFWLPVSISLTIRSIAIASKHSLSDVVTEAFMSYFDQVIPGWELNGDYVPETP